ncbi:MAG TPA: family 10 glycosylhydrolase [Chryseosolibacter sp.]
MKNFSGFKLMASAFERFIFRFTSFRIFAFLFCIASLTIASGQTYPKRELRAAWIATVVNIDWPSRKGLSAHEQQAEYVKLLDMLKSIGMNAVIVQVRPTADAFYPSSYEPWSEYLSGVQGKSPEPYYNPLAFMIHEAKKRGLEFHAWFNPYRVSMNDSTVFAATHPIHQHPEWFVTYGGKWYYDPGHPQAQEFVLQSILETVKHYDLDAVHFDDYFYPYRISNQVFPDSSTYNTYGKSVYPNVDDWRRNNVDYFVAQLASRIKNEKPHVKFGISPFGVWRNKDKDPEGSATQAGQTNYDDLYADVLKWLREGWIDYVTPQLYWNIGFKVADYAVLLDWWSKHSYGRHVYIGQGVYRVGGKGWENPDELTNQVKLNRNYTEVKGSMFFNSTTFLRNKLDINTRVKQLYAYPSLVPPMTWIDAVPPAAAALEEVKGSQGGGVQVVWSDSTSSDAAYYVIYRFEKGNLVSPDNPANIAAIVQREPLHKQTWNDRTTSKRNQYTYAIAAVDRNHNESTLSATITVRTRGRLRSVKIITAHR